MTLSSFTLGRGFEKMTGCRAKDDVTFDMISGKNIKQFKFLKLVLL